MSSRVVGVDATNVKTYICPGVMSKPLTAVAHPAESIALFDPSPNFRVTLKVFLLVAEQTSISIGFFSINLSKLFLVNSAPNSWQQKKKTLTI